MRRIPEIRRMMEGTREFARLAPLVALLAAGCAASAKAPADRPALMVPSPPARIIEAAPEPPPEPVNDLPPPPSPAPPNRARPPRESAPKPASTENKGEKAEPAKPAEPVIEPVPQPPPAPAPQLRTPETSDSSGAAKTVRLTIDRTRNLLSTVDYGPLSNDRKKAYNDAKQFLQSAEDALKQGNLVLAQSVAAKAETLALALAGK